MNMLTIHIECGPDAVDAHLQALGFMRRPFVGIEGPKVESPLARIAESMRDGTATFVPPSEDQSSGAVPQVANPLADEMSKLENPAEIRTGELSLTPDRDLSYVDHADAPKRVPGQPSPGKRRRTAAEVAEDEARPTTAGTPPAQSSRSGSTASASGAAISTGEPRVDPAVVAQDEADEARETAANKTGLTLDDVRAAFGVYSKKVGLPKAIETIREILGSPIAEIPNTQEALGAAIAKIQTACDLVFAGPAENVAPVTLAPPVATKAQCSEALMAYGKKYDGTQNPPDMICTGEDMKKILSNLFGANVTGLTAKSGFPESPENYGRARAAFVEALNGNPFGRTAKS